MVPDPAGQFYSPYEGMGNNPISQIDPDGEFAWVAFIAITTFAAASSGIAAGYQADRNGGEFWSWEGFGRGAVAGAISGAAGFGMGLAMTVNAQTFMGGLWRGALTGAFTGGMTGALSTGMMGGDIGKGFFNGMISGGISGAATGGLKGLAQKGTVIKLKTGKRAELITASGSSEADIYRHEVQKGETLSSIAEHYGTDAKSLEKFNGLKNSKIKTGQSLKTQLGEIIRRDMKTYVENPIDNTGIEAKETAYGKWFMEERWKPFNTVNTSNKDAWNMQGIRHLTSPSPDGNLRIVLSNSNLNWRSLDIQTRVDLFHRFAAPYSNPYKTNQDFINR